MSSSQYDQPLKELIDLFGDLNREGIRYCHWKSNCRLNKSLQGLTDLDLLVHPFDSQKFKLVINRYNIKQILSPPAVQYPAIEDYLGYDTETGELFHIHLHYQLILGEQFVKNYRLPLENVFLKNVLISHQVVKIPIPELELVVLSIRALLKYRDRDAIKDILSIRSQGMPIEFIDEIKYLFNQTDLEKIIQVLNKYFDFISPDIILKLLKTIDISPRSGYLFYKLRNQLKRELSAFQRYSRWKAGYRYWKASSRQFVPFLARDRYMKVPISGGQIVAVVGADGAGKSTVVNELRKWLSWKLKTHGYYMGSQRPSIATRLLELVFRLNRKLSHLWNKVFGEKNATARLLVKLQQFSRNIYHISVGHDRYHRYIAARSLAAQGAIVICDRYPLEAVWNVMQGRPMDGPQIATEAGLEMDGLTSQLSNREQTIYRKILPPDNIIVLHVSPEVSQERKPDHDQNMIIAKSQALNLMDKNGLHVIDINADNPMEQMMLQIKSALWQRL